MPTVRKFPAAPDDVGLKGLIVTAHSRETSHGAAGCKNGPSATNGYRWHLSRRSDNSLERGQVFSAAFAALSSPRRLFSAPFEERSAGIYDVICWAAFYGRYQEKRTAGDLKKKDNISPATHC